MVVSSLVITLIVASLFVVPSLVSSSSDKQRLERQVGVLHEELQAALGEISDLRGALANPKLPGGSTPSTNAIIEASDKFFRDRRMTFRRSAAFQTNSPRPAGGPMAISAKPTSVPRNLSATVWTQIADATMQTPKCFALWRDRVSNAAGGAERQGAAMPILGGDLEEPGVLEKAFASRGPAGELVFLSVGDTRDHRRADKDPALRTISTDFLLNLLANLRSIRVDYYIILSTKRLCRTLQKASSPSPPAVTIAINILLL